ncbi:unnamed protein product [Cunninghamella echinulata]
MNTSSIPLQNITHLPSIEQYVDQFINMVDSRQSIPSLTSSQEQENNNDDEESSLSGYSEDSYNNTNNNINMMRKVFYETRNDEEDNSILRNSFDEEQERLMSPSIEDNISQEELIPQQQSKDKGRKWLCFLFLAVLLLGWFVWTIAVNNIAPSSSKAYINGNHIDLRDISKTEFMPNRPELVWINDGRTDGIFSFIDSKSKDIMFESVENPEKQVLIKAKDMVIDQHELEISEFKSSKDNLYVMLWTNQTNEWRYSTLSSIYIYKKDDKTLFPLVNTSTIDTEPKISYAVWSPIGHQVAYVMENDLYITDLKKHTRITFDGSETIFNGIPDWVYEEEVLSQSYSLWWSPDATHLAYLRLDETEVPELHIPFYTLEDENSYPVEMSVKYPKAGAPNPLASLFVYSLTTTKTIMVTKNSTSDISINTKKGHEDFDEKDRIITEVHWITDSHSTLLFKQTNRVQDQELTNMVVIFDEDLKMTKPPPAPSSPLSSYVATIRKYQPKDGGWVDSGHSISYLGEYRDADDSLSIDYIDVIDNDKGFMHLALISINKDGSQIKWLTDGEWEVEQDTVVVDRDRQIVHFLSSERSPLERHLYTITLAKSDPTLSKKCLTCPEDPEVHSYYRANFSPLAGYYVLYYDGPDVPTTVVKKVDDPSFELTLQKNNNFKKLIAKYDLPKKRMLKVNSGGYDMNVLEILPPNFDIEQKYPVVFYVYGGPGSQSVTYEFNLDWHTFLASKLQYIVVIVDGRGTGFRGREYRVGVHKRLGELETIDITNAARHWANLDYVDHSRIAIWGWSYGGYLVSKCLEANSGIFNSGLAVAPVTDWRYYDSIYTERYMLTPKMNPIGYTNSAVNNMTGFANSKFLLIHGTGDDNVHFQNTAKLVDKLTQASIHTYRVQFYTDSNHLITHNNANDNLYHLLTEFLWESYGGEEYLHIRKETYGKFSGNIQSEGSHGHD